MQDDFNKNYNRALNLMSKVGLSLNDTVWAMVSEGTHFHDAFLTSKAAQMEALEKKVIARYAKRRFIM